MPLLWCRESMPLRAYMHHLDAADGLSSSAHFRIHRNFSRGGNLPTSTKWCNTWHGAAYSWAESHTQWTSIQSSLEISSALIPEFLSSFLAQIFISSATALRRKNRILSTISFQFILARIPWSFTKLLTRSKRQLKRLPYHPHRRYWHMWNLLGGWPDFAVHNNVSPIAYRTFQFSLLNSKSFPSLCNGIST